MSVAASGTAANFPAGPPRRQRTSRAPAPAHARRGPARLRLSGLLLHIPRIYLRTFPLLLINKSRTPPTRGGISLTLTAHAQSSSRQSTAESPNWRGPSTLSISVFARDNASSFAIGLFTFEHSRLTRFDGGSGVPPATAGGMQIRRLVDIRAIRPNVIEFTESPFRLAAMFVGVAGVPVDHAS